MDTNPLLGNSFPDIRTTHDASKKESEASSSKTEQKVKYNTKSTHLASSSHSSHLNPERFKKALPNQASKLDSITLFSSSQPPSISSSDMDLRGEAIVQHERDEDIIPQVFSRKRSVEAYEKEADSVKAKDFNGEAYDSELGVNTIQLLMAKKNMRESFQRDISRTNHFSINQEIQDTDQPVEILDTLKRLMTEEEFAKIPGVFQQSIYNDILLKLGEMQEEGWPPVGGGQSGEERWDISIKQNEIRIELKRSFEFPNENLKPYGIIAVQREVIIDRSNLANIRVVDRYSAFHPVQGDVEFTAMMAIKSLDRSKLEEVPTTSIELSSREVRPKIASLIQQLSDKQRIIKSKIDTSSEPIQKEILESHLNELNHSLDALKKLKLVTKIFERVEEYERQKLIFSEKMAKAGTFDELGYQQLMDKISKSETVAKRKTILSTLDTAQALLEPIENFKGQSVFSSTGIKLFLELSKGVSLEGHQEAMQKITSSTGKKRSIPLQFYKDLQRIRELKLNNTVIPCPVDESGDRIEIPDHDVYQLVQQLEGIFQQDLIPVLHALQQGLRSDIGHLVDNLQTLEPNIVKHPPGGRNNLDISINNEKNRVVIRLDSCYQLRKEDLILEEVYPYGLIAVRREIIIPKEAGEIQLKDVVIKDYYSPFLEYDGLLLGNRDAQIKPQEDLAFSRLREYIQKNS